MVSMYMTPAGVMLAGEGFNALKTALVKSAGHIQRN